MEPLIGINCSAKKTVTILEDVKINVRMKLSALWASVMFCYIYGDFFQLFTPRALEGMLAGKMGPLGPTIQGVLLGTAMLMAIPSVMVFLSLALKPKANRWANIILGVIYTIVMLIIIAMPGPWAFYIFLTIVEVMLTVLIVWYAWNWPKKEAI
jgi:hypothetical protein